jgi:hypothetical protein
MTVTDSSEPSLIEKSNQAHDKLARIRHLLEKETDGGATVIRIGDLWQILKG